MVIEVKQVRHTAVNRGKWVRDPSFTQECLAEWQAAKCRHKLPVGIQKHNAPNSEGGPALMHVPLAQMVERRFEAPGDQVRYLEDTQAHRI